MSAFIYPAAPHVRRHGPAGYADADSYRPWLRDEFAFRCVYCLYREQWGRLKAGFSLDHFLPVSRHPEHKLRYDNLLYACAACNLSKGASILPDPTQALVNRAAAVHEDGRIEGKTREAARIIRVLGLDGPRETEARLLWIGIMGLAKRSDPSLYRRLMGYPKDVPNLSSLRPPGGNTRARGIAASSFALRKDGKLSDTYE
jgi:hypothetical protein